jgi:Serine/Threonine/Tyrosine Kinase found in polyvalent proteins
MISNEIKEQLQYIVRGVSLQRPTDRCSTIRSLLVGGFGANPTVKGQFESRAILKERQNEFLKSYALQSGIWLTSLPSDAHYLTRGGESKIFMDTDKLNVIKVNDGVYYATWAEYFTSLVVHNLLFPNTAYSLVGFAEDDAKLCAVVRQPFIKGQQAKLEDIKALLTFNGFTNTKRQDYFNEEFGLILEDMHDENVISQQDVLFFIDTVFYVTQQSK